MKKTGNAHVIASLQGLTTSMDKRGRAVARRRGAGMSGLVRMALVVVMAVVFGIAGLVGSAEAAVSFDNGATSFTMVGSAASATPSGTIAKGTGNNRLLVVIITVGNSAAVSGDLSGSTVQYGGQSLTRINSTFGQRSAIWAGYLKEAGIAAASNTTITTNLSTSSVGIAKIFAAVMQDTLSGPSDDPIQSYATGNKDSYDGASVTINTPSSSLTIPANGFSFVGCAQNGTGSLTWTPAGYGYEGAPNEVENTTTNTHSVSSHAGSASDTVETNITITPGGSGRLMAVAFTVKPAPTCTDPDPSTITIPAGQTANGSPCDVSSKFNTTGDVGAFEYQVTKLGTATITNPQAWTNLYNVATSPVNVNYTVNAGTDRMLVVGVAMALSGTATASCSASYDGNAMVKATHDEASNARQHTWLFYLKDTPASMDGTANPLTVTCSNNGGRTIRNLAVYGTVFAGVDQTATPLTDAKFYNSGGTNVTTPTFASALVENTGNQPVVIGLSDRTGSTAGARTMTAATNWALVNTQTRIATDSIRTGVLNRTIPAANTTDNRPFTIATGSLASMSGMSLKPGLAPIPCTTWTSSSLIPTTTAGGSLCGDYVDGGTYTLDVRGTDPDCGDLVTTTPVDFSWFSCNETATVNVVDPGVITAPTAITVSLGGSGGSNPQWSPDGGANWYNSGATYIPPTCASGAVTFIGRATGTCGAITDPTPVNGSYNTTDSGPAGDLATITVTPAGTVTGQVAVQATVGVEANPESLQNVVVNISGSTACNVTNGVMTWNGGTGKWEYLWDTSACGGPAPTYPIENGISVVVSGNDPDCNDYVTGSATVSIDNQCDDTTSTVSWTPPGTTVSAPLVVTATLSGGTPGSGQVSFDDGNTWLPNSSTFTPGVDNQGTDNFRVRALDTCGKYIYGGPYAVTWDGRLPRIRPLSVEASAAGKTSIQILMRYCSDLNNNALVTVRYKLTAYPDVPGSWTTVGPVVDGGDADGLINEYVLFMLTGLTTDTSYDVELTVTDADGIDWSTIQVDSPTAPPWAGTVQLTSWLDSNLLHNALRFACSKIGYANQADCVAAGGTWHLDHKWAGGWGLPTAQYPGAKYDGFECSTCHMKDSSNVKRVIESVTAPSGALPGSTVNLQTVVEGSADFGDDSDNHTTSNRVCEVCHSQTTYHRFDTTGQSNKQHNNKTDCIRCHEHNVGFRASCDSCHGTPPVSSQGLVTSDPTGSTVWGEHQIHAVELGFDCKTCHNGWDGTGEMPNGGNLNIGFKPSVNPQFTGAVNVIVGGTYQGRATGSGYTGDTSTTPNTTLGAVSGEMTCATYCHGYGRPVWNPTSTVACGSCHGKVNSGVGYRSGAPTGISGSADLSGATTGFTVGKHATHLDDSVAKTGDPCALCHNGYSYTDLTHVNGTVNVSLHSSADLNTGAGQVATYNPVTHECSNMNCHGTTPWDSAAVLTCTQSCHAYPPSGGPGAFTAYTGANAINFVSHDTPNGAQYLKDNHGQCKYCHGWNDDGDGALPIIGMTPAELTAMNGDPAESTNFVNSNGVTGQHNEKAFIATPQITMNTDIDPTGDGNPANDSAYDPATGGCDNAVCHGNDAAHRLNVGTGSGNLIQSADIGPGDCGACHTTGVGGATVVTPASPHTVATVGGSFTGCTTCHSGHSSKPGGVNIPNNPAVGINYTGAQHLNGIKLGGPGTHSSIESKTTEAEICWGCHSLPANNISEWGTNTKQTGSPTYNQYNVGTLGNNAASAGGWYSVTTPGSEAGATWTSAKAAFAYKTGAIQSTHSANNIEAGATSSVTGSAYAYREALDAVALIRCSYCHDVHDAGGVGVGPTGKPYLRGTWWSNPYEEDGAPMAGVTYSNTQRFGAVPRGNGVNQRYLGGFWVDANNAQPGTATTSANGTSFASPTATGGSGTGGAWTLANNAGLCVLCHGNNVDTMNWNTTETNVWLGTNGHANAVIGGSGAGAANIFEARGGTTNSNRAMMHWYGSGGRPEDWNSGFRNSAGDSQYSYAPLLNPLGENNENTTPNTNNWGSLTINDTSINTQYHKFPCSKCHNPHASRLPKLMITNCLDTKHNTWDDDKALNQQNDTLNLNRSFSNWSSAQNCHRLGGVIPSNRVIPATGGTYPEPVDTGAVAAPQNALPDYQNRGWNTVTPW